MEPAACGVLAVGKKTVQRTVLRVGRTGGNPVGVTKQVKGEPVSVRRRIRFYHILKKVKYIEKAGNETHYFVPCFAFMLAVPLQTKSCRQSLTILSQ